VDVRPDPETSLAQPCIADTSLLSNFVHTGYAYLLHRLLPEPVLLSPTVLDPAEVLLPRPYTQARLAASKSLPPTFGALGVFV